MAKIKVPSGHRLYEHSCRGKEKRRVPVRIMGDSDTGIDYCVCPECTGTFFLTQGRDPSHSNNAWKERRGKYVQVR